MRVNLIQFILYVLVYTYIMHIGSGSRWFTIVHVILIRLPGIFAPRQPAEGHQTPGSKSTCNKSTVQICPTQFPYLPTLSPRLFRHLCIFSWLVVSLWFFMHVFFNHLNIFCGSTRFKHVKMKYAICFFLYWGIVPCSCFDWQTDRSNSNATTIRHACSPGTWTIQIWF